MLQVDAPIGTETPDSKSRGAAQCGLTQALIHVLSPTRAIDPHEDDDGAAGETSQAENGK